MRLQIRTLMAVGAVAVAGLAQASVLTYDPSLGTLPQAQGWTFAGTYNAPMSVAGGTLTYGPTTVNGTTAWERLPTETTNFATQTVYIEATIKLTGADFGNFSGFRRGGLSLYLEDDFGRWIIADMGDNRISLGNDNNRTSDPVAVFDLTSSFHTVRLEAGPGGSRLLVDGVEQLTLALGSGMSGGAQVTWGEGTILANADMTQVQGAVYVPAPGAAVVLGVGALLARRRRA